jgi:hypothetical protein
VRVVSVCVVLCNLKKKKEFTTSRTHFFLHRRPADAPLSSRSRGLACSPPDPSCCFAPRPAARPARLHRWICGEPSPVKEQAPGMPGPLPFILWLQRHHHDLMEMLVFFLFLSVQRQERGSRFSLQFVDWIRSLPQAKDPRVLFVYVS